MRKLLYEGKSKQIYATDAPDKLLMVYKDDLTAFNGAKKGIIKDKGIINNRISCCLFKYLEQQGIETHLVRRLDDRNVLVKRLQMLPVEVVVRNLMAGSLAQRFGKLEGTELPYPIIEFYYKDDQLGDPMVNESHITGLGWASKEQLQTMQALAFKINQLLSDLFTRLNIILVDLKLEFGTIEGRIVLGDEISPDSCRLWDKLSLDKLDKDRFRRGMGNETEAYQEVARRIESLFDQ
ncbi:MAG: phosphoribosylaminoimidazolesuccinocarboxamide synthase [Syntrophomonadaceae bacterium]|nr:phosphoribosylaminoimidazolesuccinocarboxamide synthase [Syntrophomonadaceae bacterium]